MPNVLLSSSPGGLSRSSPGPSLPLHPHSDRSPCWSPAFSAYGAPQRRDVTNSEVGNGRNDSTSSKLSPSPLSIAELVSPDSTARSTPSPHRTSTAEVSDLSSTTARPTQSGSNIDSLANQPIWTYLAFANTEEAEHLLPPSLTDILVRVPHPCKPGTTAVDISMSYPGDPSQQLTPKCQISFVISIQSTGQVIEDLFGFHLVRDGSLQYIVTPGGSELVPRPHIVLRGAKADAVKKLFGCDLYHSMLYCGRPGRDSPWLLVPENSCEKATLSICISARAAFVLRERLY